MELIIVALMGIFFGAASVEQAHFNQCEELHFKGKACEAEKILCMQGKDVARCL